MAPSDIFLILISGSGLLHGVFFAVYLCLLTKKRTRANLWLGLLLIFMAFRIGKSVLLYFAKDLEPLFIFIGLSFLLVIGPLLHWYVKTMTDPLFQPRKINLLEFSAFVFVFLSGFFVSPDWFDEHNSQAIAFFASIIVFTYLHFAFYILKSVAVLKRVAKNHPRSQQTKSQSAVIHWLRVLLVGFGVIWVSYVLNIIEDTVPYIFGPIVYSIAIYYLSFKAFRLKALTYDGAVFGTDADVRLFQRMEDLVLERKLYLDSGISLRALGIQMNQSTQKTSELINQFAKRNFNDFINYYRIQEAKKMLLDSSTQKFTISAIAFDCGFSSLSSFNLAFKKFEGITPSTFRKKGP